MTMASVGCLASVWASVCSGCETVAGCWDWFMSRLGMGMVVKKNEIVTFFVGWYTFLTFLVFFVDPACSSLFYKKFTKKPQSGNKVQDTRGPSFSCDLRGRTDRS